MLNNTSVSVKGFVAFGILAVIAIGASTLMHSRAVSARQHVAETTTANSVVAALDEYSTDLFIANVQLKSFLLTGNRDYATQVAQSMEEMKQERSELEALVAEESPDESAVLQDALANFDQWRTNFADRQIQLMRDPMTVELARAF